MEGPPGRWGSRIAFQKRIVQIEEKEAMAELIADENRIMMLNLNAMDEFTHPSIF
jgi:hypothetical protein